MTTESAAHKELLQLNQRLLDCIMVGDWETYATLCDPTISAFEAEACGELVEGLDFHGFYFDPGGAKGPHNTTMTRPHVRIAGRGRGRGLLRPPGATHGRGRQAGHQPLRGNPRLGAAERHLAARAFSPSNSR